MIESWWARCALALMLLCVTNRAGAEARFAIDVRVAGPPLSAEVLKAMRSEAVAIWNRYGVRLLPPPTAECDSEEPIAGWIDVLVERQATHASSDSRIVLGSTRLPRTPADRMAIRIDYDAVQDVVAGLRTERRLALTAHGGIESVDIGRATGRVLAHEIGHLLLHDRDHTDRGLMRSSYRPEDLLMLDRMSFSLSPAELSRLHDRGDEAAAADR